MKLILVRHGHAYNPRENPDEPLKPEGREAVIALSEKIKKRVNIQRIIHSEKTRARDTAQILLEYAAPDASIEEHPNLAPNDPAEPILNEIVGEKENLIIVTHLPFILNFLEKVGAPLIELEPAGAICLNESHQIEWTIS